MLAESIGRNALLLGLFAVVTTGIIAATFLNSQEAINTNIRKAEERSLLEIVSKDHHNNEMLDDAHLVSDTELLGLRAEKKFYIARHNNQPVAVIFPVTTREGYTGDIDLIVGIHVDGSITGVRVLSHRETPGLGDAIDKNKSDWVDGFVGRSLNNPSLDQWKVRKDKGVFDQFTGATITPRAVTHAVLNALKYFDQQQQRILQLPATSNASNSHD